MADISFFGILGLLWGFQFCLCATTQDRIVEKKVVSGQRVDLICELNTTDDVTWSYYHGQDLYIYTCQNNQNGQCKPKDISYLVSDLNVQATRSNGTSILSLTPSTQRNFLNFNCLLGSEKHILREFAIISVDPNNIVPNCTMPMPGRDQNGDVSMALSCEVNSYGLDVIFTLDGIGLDIHDDPWSSQSIKNKTIGTKTLHFDNFNNVFNASCNVRFPDIHLNKSCLYSNIIKTENIVEGEDVIIECDNESDVDWHLIDLDGREEDIKNRSWIRDGGRTLLIRRISEQDVGKVVLCRTKGDTFISDGNGTIEFTFIKKISRETEKSNSEDSETNPRAQNPFIVPLLLFLALWLITTAVGGVCMWSRYKQNKTLKSTSGNEGQNGGGGERETSLVNVRTEARGNPGNSNTNNSAHNPDFELEGDSTVENKVNRQSNNGSHLYFTLEKSSPSPVESFRRASKSRCDCHAENNPASLNQPQSSHWQGYEIVGDSSKGATCVFDLGEYAEVGDHLLGRSHPDQLVRPPTIRQKPGRKEVKEDVISMLYSKVNK